MKVWLASYGGRPTNGTMLPGRNLQECCGVTMAHHELTGRRPPAFTCDPGNQPCYERCRGRCRRRQLPAFRPSNQGSQMRNRAHPVNACFVLEKVDMLSSLGVTQPVSRGGNSMSTSLLYHAFGLVGYRYVSQYFEEGQVIFRIEQPRERLRCSALRLRRRSGPRAASTAPSAPCPSAASRCCSQFKVPRVLLLRLRPGPAGQARLRRPQEALHPGLRALRPGAVAAHDHPGRGRAPAGQLGHHQGHPGPLAADAASASPSCTSSSRSPSTRSPSARGTAT